MAVLFKSVQLLTKALFVTLAVIGMTVVWTSVSSAQISTATLSGTVKDPTGAVVPKAKVELKNVGTSVINATVTNQAGAFAFVNLNPGTYTLQASAAGFRTAQVSAFTLTVGQRAAIAVSLQVGGKSTVVHVQGMAPQLNTTSASLGTVMGTKAVNDLPLNGRNFTQLLSLTPGVVSISDAQNSNHGVGGSFNVQPAAAGSAFSYPSVNGENNRSDLFFTDGIFNEGTLLSTYAVPPIIDAIQEFKVVSHTDDAQYGATMGGVIDVVTKSGTNHFHGALFSYYRDQVLDARAFFLPLSSSKTPYHQNQFGGVVGGPVLLGHLYNGRNKTFFFAGYQGFRYATESDTPLHVPTAAELAGNESDWPTQIYNPYSTVPNPNAPGEYIRQPFPNNQIPSNLIDPTMVAFAQFVFPKAGPVIDAAGDNALDTTPIIQNQDQFTLRIDQSFGSNNSGWFRYSRFFSQASSSGGLPTLRQTTETPAQNWGGSFTHVFGPSLIAQAQIGRVLLADNASTLFTQPITSIMQKVGFAAAFTGNFEAANGGDLLPSPGIAGYSDGGDSIQNEPKETASWQYSGSVTKTTGNHIIQAGGDYISAGFVSPIGYDSLNFTAQNTGDTNPADVINTGDPIASFVLNVPSSGNRRNVNETERPGGVLSAYVQDSWKALSKLTINYGIRYDLTLIPAYGAAGTERQHGGIVTGDMDFNNGTYIIQKLPPACSSTVFAPCIPGGVLPAHVVVSPNAKIAHNEYNEFGPRFGISYQMRPETVVHMGFGIVYDNWAAVTQMAQNIEGSWPDIGQQISNNLNLPSSTSATPTVKAQDPFAGGSSSLYPAATPFNQVQWFYDPKIKNPYSEQFNFGVSHQLNTSTNLTVNYVGSVGRRLDVGGFYNTAKTPGPGDPQARAPFPYIAPTFYDHSVGSNSYNALQVSLSRRYVKGLSYQLSYTWSKDIDVGGDGWFGVEGGVPQDPYDPAGYGSRSVSGIDLTNVLTADQVWELPFGPGNAFSVKNKILNYIIGDWQLNNILTAESGQPFTPVTSSDVANIGSGLNYEHLNIVGNPNNAPHTAAKWFNTTAYITPPGYTYGTAGRDSLRSQAYVDLDTSIFRQFPIGGGRSFVFRVEAFNALNHPVLGIPDATINDGTRFGTVNYTASTAREVQLAGKFIF